MKLKPIRIFLPVYICLFVLSVSVFHAIPSYSGDSKDAGSKDTKQKWEFYGESHNGIRCHYDKGSVIQLSDNTVRVLRKRTFPQGAAQKEIITLDEIDCRLRTFRTIELTIRNNDDSLETFSKVSGWSKIYGQTPEAYLLTDICK